MIAGKYWDGILKAATPVDCTGSRLVTACNMLLPESFFQDAKARWATLAWCNGARLRALSGQSSREVFQSLGIGVADAVPLMRDVLGRQDGAGFPDNPLDAIRDTFSEMVGSGSSDPASSGFLGLCAYAGWQSVEEGSLFAAHVLADLKIAGQATQILTDLLQTDHGGLTPSEKTHAFSFFSAVSYPTTPVERAAVTMAIADSFREAREENFDEAAFLNHAFHLGGELGRTDVDAALRVIGGIGTEPLRTTFVLFDKFLDCPFGEATPSEFYNSMLKWSSDFYTDLAETDYPPFKVLLLRHAYDYLFWAGLLLEMRHRCSL